MDIQRAYILSPFDVLPSMSLTIMLNCETLIYAPAPRCRYLHTISHRPNTLACPKYIRFKRQYIYIYMCRVRTCSEFNLIYRGLFLASPMVKLIGLWWVFKDLDPIFLVDFTFSSHLTTIDYRRRLSRAGNSLRRRACGSLALKNEWGGLWVGESLPIVCTVCKRHGACFRHTFVNAV